MSKKILVAFILCILGISYLAWAQNSQTDQKVNYTPANKECYSAESAGVPWKYCVYTPAEGKSSGRLAYMLHGRSLDENAWNDDTYYTSMIQQYWQKNKITPPTVVAVSFGKVWLLAPKGKMPASGLVELFAGAVIPEVEKRVGVPQERILFGESMGGLNSLVLGLRKNSLFKKVAALCAPVYLGTPFDSNEDLEKFYERTGADRQTMAGVIQLAKVFYSDKNEWDNAAPIKVLEQMDTKSAPKMYLSCGLYDKYGNYEGAEHLANLAQEKAIGLEWRPLYGPHCAVDIPSVAEFLAK